MEDLVKKIYAERDKATLALKTTYEIKVEFAKKGYVVSYVGQPESSYPWITINCKESSFEETRKLVLLLLDRCSQGAKAIKKTGSFDMNRADILIQKNSHIIWNGKDKNTERKAYEDAFDLTFPGSLNLENSNHTGAKLTLNIYCDDYNVKVDLNLDLFKDRISPKKYVIQGREDAYEYQKKKVNPDYSGILFIGIDFHVGLQVQRFYGNRETLYCKDASDKKELFDLFQIEA